MSDGGTIKQQAYTEAISLHMTMTSISLWTTLDDTIIFISLFKIDLDMDIFLQIPKVCNESR